MVIQSLRNSYARIPDEEDVTPLDTSLVTVKRRFGRHVVVGFAVAALIIAACVLYVFYFNGNHEVVVFCTKKDGKGLQRMSLRDLRGHDSQAHPLHRGGASCTSGHLCSGLAARATVTVKPQIQYQKILGFGGAFTEATAHNFFKLPKSVQKRMLSLYFGRDGIGLTMGRIHINSCDFSLESYSFDDVPQDYDLQHFDDEVVHDTKEIIPLILAANERSKRRIRLVASPWSPPAWMKTPVNGKQSMLGSATPAGLLGDPRVHQAWAKYISRFVTAYRKKGVAIWAITPQNEPEFPAPWEACSFNASAELDFITNYLGPVLRSEHPELKLLAFDHNKDHLQQWAELLYRGDVGGYIDGMAFHWYGGEDRMTDGTYGYNTVRNTHFLAPDKVLLGTEACSCPGVMLHDWLRAERVGHDILFDLLNYAQGWLDWNLLVDSSGGPNHLENNCDASLVASPDFHNIQVQPKYYYLGHFSKFVPPGSVRVDAVAIGNFGYVATDPMVQANLELGMFPCERSARQVFRLDPEKFTLHLQTQPSEGPALCAVHGDSNRNYFRLGDCDEDSQRSRVLKLHFQTDSMLAIDLDTGLCLSVAAEGREAGALLELTPCGTPVRGHQKFMFDAKTGEIISTLTGYCVTAGWPYLNAAAFTTPVEEGHKTVVVIMNEAPIPTPIDLLDNSRQDSFTAPAHSILTLIY